MTYVDQLFESMGYELVKDGRVYWLEKTVPLHSDVAKELWCNPSLHFSRIHDGATGYILNIAIKADGMFEELCFISIYQAHQTTLTSLLKRCDKAHPEWAWVYSTEAKRIDAALNEGIQLMQGIKSR